MMWRVDVDDHAGHSSSHWLQPSHLGISRRSVIGSRDPSSGPSACRPRPTAAPSPRRAPCRRTRSSARHHRLARPRVGRPTKSVVGGHDRQRSSHSSPRPARRPARTQVHAQRDRRARSRGPRRDSSPSPWRGVDVADVEQRVRRPHRQVTAAPGADDRLVHVAAVAARPARRGRAGRRRRLGLLGVATPRQPIIGRSGSENRSENWTTAVADRRRAARAGAARARAQSGLTCAWPPRPAGGSRRWRGSSRRARRRARAPATAIGPVIGLPCRRAAAAARTACPASRSSSAPARASRQSKIASEPGASVRTGASDGS